MRLAVALGLRIEPGHQNLGLRATPGGNSGEIHAVQQPVGPKLGFDIRLDRNLARLVPAADLPGERAQIRRGGHTLGVTRPLNRERFGHQQHGNEDLEWIRHGNGR